MFTGNIYFRIWIDGKDQIRQLVEHETVSVQPLTITARYTSFSQPVTIAIPPASQVLQFPGGTLPGAA
jgi:hypothetical protein